MKHVLEGPPATLPADRAKRERRAIDVTGIGRLVRLTLRLSVAHTDATDLRARLIAPWGERFELGRALVQTTSWVFGRRDPNGRWVLEIDDLVAGDGGTVDWALEIETDETGPFVPEVEFVGPWSESQRAACERGIGRLARCFTAALEPATLSNGRRVESHLVTLKAKHIDGPGGILGQSGPRALRWENDLPIWSIQTLDTADRDELHDDGELEHVVAHELIHGLGGGTIWSLKGLLLGAGGSDPRFSGKRAGEEWHRLGGSLFVPVANTGGGGSRDSHLRESTFDAELFTPYFDSGRANPISRVTIAHFADLGYEVDLDAADEYSLPSTAGAALRFEGRRQCGVLSRPTPGRIGGPS